MNAIEDTILFRGKTDAGDVIELIMVNGLSSLSKETYIIRRNGVLVDESYHTSMAAQKFIKEFNPTR